MDGGWSRVAAWSEPRTVPWTQAWLTRGARRDSVATLAMFESEAHGLALWRSLTRRRRPPLVIIGCWLGELAQSGGHRRDLYRWLYQAADAVVVFSSNQVDTLVDLLDIPRERIHAVHFGVDLDELVSVEPTDSGTVVAIGRDLGRDWTTLNRAAVGTGWEVDLMTRRQQVNTSALPPEVRFLEPAGRGDYLRVLARASVVVLPTEVREYPTGQTVLLEAMALGKACVVTDTPAMRGYVTHGVDAVLVPAHDPTALRSAVSDLLADPARRGELGRAARATSNRSGGATAMWAKVAEVVGKVVGRAEV